MFCTPPAGLPQPAASGEEHHRTEHTCNHRYERHVGAGSLRGCLRMVPWKGSSDTAHAVGRSGVSYGDGRGAEGGGQADGVPAPALAARLADSVGFPVAERQGQGSPGSPGNFRTTPRCFGRRCKPGTPPPARGSSQPDTTAMTEDAASASTRM
eukprot:6649196-Prymnesium_polylepis.2